MLFYTLLFSGIKAQIGIGTTTPQATLDINSATQGILIPRMNGTQAQAIVNPKLGELVYALSGDGTIINTPGFWYYNGTAWKPFGSGGPVNNNIYIGNGTLTSDRTINMKGQNLSFDSDKLILQSTNQRIGVGELNPEYSLDVNGNVRVRNLSGGNVIATTDGTLAIGPKVRYGTVKESMRLTDHNGWYLLDGRAVTAIPAAAQNNAASIGISGNLINANNLLMRQGSTLTTGGASSLALLRANLPNYNMTGTTTTAGDHTHTVTSQGQNVASVATGNAFIVRAGRGTSSGTSTVAMPSSGGHTHTGAIGSGGSGTPISIIPESIKYTYFIYLGQ